MNQTTPQSKGPSLFTPRQRRIETITEALERFAGIITGRDVAANVKSVIDRTKAGEDVELRITLRVRRDPRTPDGYAVSMDTKFSSELSREHFLGLR